MNWEKEAYYFGDVDPNQGLNNNKQKGGYYMKKQMLIFVLTPILFLLFACRPFHSFMTHEELMDNILCVDLINYNNPDLKKSGTDPDKLIPFDFTKMEIIETLKEERIDNFLYELSRFPFAEGRYFDSPQGESIRLLYNNGDFIIISCKAKYAGSFYKDGNVKKFLGYYHNSELRKLINNNFDSKV